MTPAEELRAAAAKLRETAGTATDGPWQLDGPYWWHSGDCTHVVTDARDRMSVAVMPQREDAPHRDANAAWIALAHPGLAEPLAKWLEREAKYAERAAGRGSGFLSEPDREALAVARAILGGAQ